MLLLLCLLCAPWSSARAQLVADGATNTINNVTNNLGSTTLVIGTNGPNTALILTNNGTVIASNGVVLGLNAGATNSRLTVDGGTLRVTNNAGTATLEIRRGTNVFNAGLITADNR